MNIHTSGKNGDTFLWTACLPLQTLHSASPRDRCPLLLDTDSLDAAEASFETLDGPFGSAESAGNPSRFAVVHPFLGLILLLRILARSRIFGSYLGIGPRQLLLASDIIMRHVLISRYGR
ncbi:uncharacterized protein RSE6_08039 [Rhynchosporium secalis]|uniref:Uncharacterized protein n=1 Tax=Rhynchosporium secalis TaxID=38038 RepID=A0A1E1MEE3_RHYSE|nr:uncharacterized protein RSE6_08039 [Rhynchosporium secalis]